MSNNHDKNKSSENEPIGKEITTPITGEHIDIEPNNFLENFDARKSFIRGLVRKGEEEILKDQIRKFVEAKKKENADKRDRQIQKMSNSIALDMAENQKDFEEKLKAIELQKEKELAKLDMQKIMDVHDNIWNALAEKEEAISKLDEDDKYFRVKVGHLTSIFNSKVKLYLKNSDLEKEDVAYLFEAYKQQFNHE